MTPSRSRDCERLRRAVGGTISRNVETTRGGGTVGGTGRFGSRHRARPVRDCVDVTHGVVDSVATGRVFNRRQQSWPAAAPAFCARPPSAQRACQPIGTHRIPLWGSHPQRQLSDVVDVRHGANVIAVASTAASPASAVEGSGSALSVRNLEPRSLDALRMRSLPPCTQSTTFG